MISDRERKALRELERGIMADDPRFASSFEARAQGKANGTTRKAWLTVAAVITATLGILMLATEAVGTFCTLVLGIGVAWWTWQLFMDAKETRRRDT